MSARGAEPKRQEKETPRDAVQSARGGRGFRMRRVSLSERCEDSNRISDRAGRETAALPVGRFNGRSFRFDWNSERVFFSPFYPPQLPPQAIRSWNADRHNSFPLASEPHTGRGRGGKERRRETL